MKQLKKLLLALSLLVASLARADEGMWLPLLLEKLNEKQMKSLGMKISAKDIYNINSGSLKDAIVSFGGFCTAEIISSKGLLLTNHHCGFDAIQNHSTIEHNYIRDGFWARSQAEEMPNPGLFATFIVKIEDVSKQVLNGVTDAMTEQERQATISKNITALRGSAKKESYQDSFIRAFFEGNQYYMFVTETYSDIRLVGAPPSSIGNFGKDTDNWMWPRHTGDFSMFRIYAGKDNKPAKYSPDNVPYVPKRSLSISLDGLSQNDFTMVFGFPGRTMEYLPAVAVEQIVKVNDPVKIAIREKAMGVIDAWMRKDEQVKIQYASKYAGISNSYKKWKGEILGLERTRAVEKKRAYEAEFLKRVAANPNWKARYGNLLGDLEETYTEFEIYGKHRDYFTEIGSRMEIFAIAANLNQLANLMEKNGKEAMRKDLPRVRERLEELYKEYNAEVDKQVFAVLMEKFVTEQEQSYLSPVLLNEAKAKGWNYTELADDIYSNTILDEGDKVLAALEKDPEELLEDFREGRVYKIYAANNAAYSTNIASKLQELQARLNKLQREYMQAQMEVFREKVFYPDANSTLRVTYGKVNGYEPRNAVKYDYYTYLDGIMEKYVPGDYEFDVPEKLMELYRTKNYGQYAQNGKVPVCFIATNHTTGGNSGSPALDAYGNLVGLNFDRVWEGTMSDINYDPSICRNIMVDIRYVLFIVDKYAGAQHLIKEMKLVHPKKKPR
jgi:hypothetical protein